MNETFWDIVLSPAHTFAEIFWTLVLDVLVAGILWPKIRGRIKHEHAVIDAEHGYDHDGFITPGTDVMVPILHDVPVPFLLTDLGWAAQH